MPRVAINPAGYGTAANVAKSRVYNGTPSIRNPQSRAAQGSIAGTNGLNGARRPAGAPTVAVIRKNPGGQGRS
jgi:hypothetical protein